MVGTGDKNEGLQRHMTGVVVVLQLACQRTRSADYLEISVIDLYSAHLPNKQPQVIIWED